MRIPSSFSMLLDALGFRKFECFWKRMERAKVLLACVFLRYGSILPADIIFRHVSSSSFPRSFFFHPGILVVQCILRKRIKDAIRILQQAAGSNP